MGSGFTFQSERPFHKTLQARVEERLAALGRSRFGAARFFGKTVVLLLWAGLSYAGLLAAAHWWQVAPLAVSLGLAVAALGFNVGHDGNHGASSRSRALNRAYSSVFDLLGGSSWVWRFKHNVLHHSYTNVHGLDDDIDLGSLCRMSQHQPHLPHHRFQQFYMWALYSLLVPKWHLWDDLVAVTRGRIGDSPLRRPRGGELALFVGGKLAFLGWCFVVPALLHPLWAVLLTYAAVAMVQGLTLSVVFQLAHSINETESFTLPEALPEAAAAETQPLEWAVHQVETTANFARRNRLLTWYVGGLNHQVEHHLFPRISHVHLPLIADEVARVCREYGVRYREHLTFRSALASHYRWLRALGRVPERA